MPDALPIESSIAGIREALGRGQTLVLEAPPGAGKTTRVPLALLDEPWLAGKRILMLEPRRLAARAAAARMAETLGEQVGETVGFTIRFERKTSARTRIEVVTEGILTRRLQSDPELDGIGLVIFDEFHERHLDSDLGLALCFDTAQALREDLRLLVMSATLDGERTARLLDAPRLTSEGRSYPVEVRYRPVEPRVRLSEAVARVTRQVLEEAPGDVLVFLPGAGEIRRTAQLLQSDAKGAGFEIHPLYGVLSQEAQRAAIRPAPSGARKVVLATNIAETSLTIEGVGVVVDSGWMRVSRFDPRSGLNRLETVRVSRASAEQRRGRAGRLGPGVCYRLWSESTQEGLVAHNRPEILDADLAGLALELARWGVTNPETLRWLDIPPAGAWSQAQALLQRLEAIDSRGRITAEGRAIAKLPTHPRLAHMLHRAAGAGAGGLACDVAALLEERDVLRKEVRDCDFLSRLQALRRYRRDGRAGAQALHADPAACARVEKSARQFARLLGESGSGQAELSPGLLLALAYPDRVGQPRAGSRRRYRLAGGSGAVLSEGCNLGGSWLTAASLDGAGKEARIYIAASLEVDELRQWLPEQLSEEEVVRWDPESGSVVAQREERFGKLLLDASPLGHIDAGDVAAAMLDGVRQLGVAALPWTPEAERLRGRVAFLRHHFPEQGWPDLSDAALTQDLDPWLLPYLTGIRRREHLRRLDMAAILRAALDWPRQQQLQEGAPERIALPSGRSAAIDYSDAENPVLAVKLQEMFGEKETPTVGWGHVPLTLHLLSPARRPVQVTRDLRGFWERTYPEVKKELKGRYPKHPWPDDPWIAPATAGTRRGGKRKP